MRYSPKLFIATLTASLTLAATISTATANRIAFDEQGFRQPMTEFTVSESGGGFAVSCRITLEGSFHSRSISKASEALIGYIRTAAVEPLCIEGRMRILTETLPWHVRYESFSGTLPNITGINLRDVGMALAIEKGLSAVCLLKATTANPAKSTLIVSGGVIWELDFSSSATIPSTGMFCPFATGRFSGFGAFGRARTTSIIDVTLVQ